MNNRTTNSHQFGEPPPLPCRTDERRQSATFFAAIVAGIAFVLALLLLMLLGEPSPLTASSDAKGDNHLGTNRNVVNSQGTDQSDDRSVGAGGRENSHQTTDASHADNTKSRVVNIEDASAARIARVDADSEPITVASEEHSEEVGPRKPSQADTVRRSAGNQFFTLGGPRDRVQRPAQGEDPHARSTVIRDAFSGRAANGKQKMLRAHGGTAATEAAVKLGLEWLAKNQLENGLWSLTGPYDDGGPMENSAAATAMALLAFQGAGHTHKEDRNEPFTRVVARGSNALLKHVFDNENSNNHLGQGSGYAQAMCTIAISELFGMTHDQTLRVPAKQAVEYCASAQSPQGGWRYVPGQDSDTSVTGWFVMGLQSARMAGLRVPNEVFDGASVYLNAAANQYGSRYSYQPGVVPTPSMTAEALLCRQYLGWQRNDPRLQDGAQYLLAHLPDWNSRDVYYWYYATQVCHHMGGDYWQQWNSVMRELLPAKQIKDGQQRGSWDPRGDRWGTSGGRLYVTCMCLYMLEVYYRYLPLYQDAAIGDR